MRSAKPEMRAAQLKEDLAALSELGSDVASRILADLPSSMLHRIVHSTRVDWIPLEVCLELTRAVHGAAGDDGVRRWARAAAVRSVSTTLFKPLVESAFRVFGLSPTSIFKMSPQAWRQTFRGCGDLVVLAHRPLACRLGIQGAPPQVLDRPFLVSFGGALELAFDTCKVEGRVSLLAPSMELSAEYEASWVEARVAPR